MVIIQQVFDSNVQLRPPCSKGLRERIQNHKLDRKHKYSCSSTRCAQDEEFIEHLWETEGSHCVESGLSGRLNQRKRKREKAYFCPEFLRHDGHFGSVPRAKHMRKDEFVQESSKPEPCKPRCACESYMNSDFGGCTSGFDTIGDWEVRQESCACGNPCFEKTRERVSHCSGCCASKREECLDSSYDLLSARPRKLSHMGNTKYQRPPLTRSPSPCESVSSVRDSIESLSSAEMCRLEELMTSPASQQDGDQTDESNPASSPRSPQQNLQVALPQSETPSAHNHQARIRSSSAGRYGLYNMACTKPRNPGQRLSNQLEHLTLTRESCPYSQANGFVTERLKDVHKATLKKVQSPSMATRLDNMKATILSHGFYPRLVDAYIKHRKVGASPELMERLRDLQAQMRHWQPSSLHAPETNETIDSQNQYHAMLSTYEKLLEKPFQNSMKFCATLEKDLEQIATRSSPQATRISPPRGPLPTPLNSNANDPERNIPTKKPAWR